MQIPSETLARALRKGLGVCNTYLPHLEYFEQLATVAPELEPIVSTLRVKIEHLDRLCKAGLLMSQQANGE